MNAYAYDLEIFPNIFTATYLNTKDDKDIKSFIISWDLKIDDRDKMKEFLSTEVSMLIGYNNLIFDTPILMQVLEYQGLDINKDVFDHSQRIINSDRIENYNKLKNLPWEQLDLMKLMAFDKLGVSLKQCAINLKWKKIQDLPLPYDHIVTREDIELILKYNINDVLITNELYKALQPQIQMRIELGNLYNVNLLSASDSKIANILLEKFYTEETGTDIKDLKYLRTKRDFLWLKDCICPGIKFITKKMRNLKFEIANNLVVAENNFAFKKQINFGNCSYEIGVGGLHSDDGPNIFKDDENYIIRDLDGISYYPSIIINNNIKPDHLNEDFVKTLKRITSERVEAKKSGNKTKADGLKITVNSIFGKLGSETFWLEDAKAMLTVTVSGQLYLLMLVEQLTLAGIIVISANTDGIVCKIPRYLEDKYYEVCDNWMTETGFVLEYNDYALYVRSDVNNYIVKKHNGETKEKGRYLKTIDLKKGYHYPIVPYCFYEYFINNQSIEKSLQEATDILDFCISQKSGKDFTMEYRTDDGTITPLQKTNRFFISNRGGHIVKVNKVSGTEIGLYVNNYTSILNDHDNLVPITDYDINYSFYKEEAEKYIADIEKSSFPDVLIQEELSTDKEDGIELEIDNFDTSKIKILSPRYKHSKEGYYFDKLNNVIYRSISSIKFITSNVAKEIERLNDNNYSTFVDLLADIENNYKVNSRQMDILIKLNFFEEFGCNKKLLNVYNEFNNGINRYNKTLKIGTKEKRLQLLRDFENNIENVKMNILDQIYFELDILGYIQTTFPQLDKRYIYVLKLDTVYSPRIEIQCLNSAATQTLKIQKRIFDNNNFQAGNILFCGNRTYPKLKSFEKKKPVKMINGEFKEVEGSPVFWLTNYEVLTKDEIENLI